MYEALLLVLITAVPVLVGFIVKFLHEKAAALAASTHNEKVQAYLLELSDAVETAVTATSQAYVDSLKASGSFDEDARKEALGKAKDAALSVLTSACKDFLEEAYDDLDTLLEVKIEEEVRYQNEV